MLDRAAAADSRVDRVAPRAEPVILDLQIEALVEIQRRAVLIQLSADAGAVGKDEIDLLRARQERTPNLGDRNAFGALLLDPLDLGHEWAGLDRDADDDFVLNNETSDRLTNGARLCAEYAEKQRQQVPNSAEGHLMPNPMNGGFAAKR